MIRRDEELIKYLRDELPSRVGGALNGDGASVLSELSKLCVEALNRSCNALGVECGGDELTNAWRVMERVVELSNEFVLARYMAIVASSNFIASRANPVIVGMLGRDLLTCIEKVRVIILRMVEEGRPWREIYGLG
ncbi:hypothetical protein [Vulcanisaeta distributa]|uniref:PaREP1 family protein n=1 Tax=Vulcanisaeta distributa (strain DSM 14429 / JCM 11212 / NBRC 100878 / IC-017) TaxID=572478 RepID=E1QVB3_VULDI|nr:hypothetical protein [Vulcanisaeta distributa]ADN50040.1 hypothetical protein Vdis_0645 [Vulcanisaeta distributa DSM 14429]